MKPSNALSNCATLAAVSSDIWQILFGLLLDLLKIIMTWPRFEPGTSCTQSEPSTIWLPCHITRCDLSAKRKKMSHFRFLHSTHISIFGILVKFYINKIMYNQLRFYANFHLCTTLRQYGNMPILLLDAKFHLYAKFHLVANFNRNANFHLDANFNPYANFHLHEILDSVRFFCKMTICFSKYRKICNSFIAYSHEIDDLKNLDQKIIFLYVPSDTSAGYLVAEKWFAARILSLENPSASVLAGLNCPFSLERGHSSDSVGWDVNFFFQNFQII